VEALRRPLSFAARDNFAGLDRVSNLGGTLAGACARLGNLVGGERASALLAWGRELMGFDQRPRGDREKLVARGMRLVATCALDLPKTPPPPQPRSDPARSPAPSLNAPLTALPGVGPRTAERLAQKGLATISDVLHFIPRRWDDLRKLTATGALVPGVQQVTRATVASSRVVFGRKRFFEVTLTGDDGAKLKALWFYFRGSMKERFQPGARFLLAGTPRPYQGAMQMAHPETTLLDEDEGGEIGQVRARYPEVEGIGGRLIEKIARAAAEHYSPALPDGLPEAIRSRRALPSQSDALRTLHLADATPLSEEAVAELNRAETPSQKRLAYDELFFLQLGLARRRQLVHADDGAPCPPANDSIERFFSSLPFAPTNAQRRAVAEIGADMAKPHPMHRLLQGDVGSGKTVVMFAAALQAIAAGMQVAIMAPTELLAEQHARTLANWTAATGTSAALLTASTPRGARESILRLLAAGRLDVVVGTHALLAEAVGFHKLGLVVIDEQHRFGVAQRATLRDKGAGTAPHLLVMTATPIPRTLALTAYGDLDLTLLDELPPGREPADTRVMVGARGKSDAYKLLARALAAGRQGYVVCPLVEESEKIDLADAVATHQRLVAEIAPIPVGLVHGRMSAAERDDTMDAFRAGQIRLLVATTVVEVGVDVPAAAVMLIDGAERFGLSQLHQLRGRIGRGGGKPLCLLVSDEKKTSVAGERLAVMAASADGFVIAEEDLKLRGPGELYGTRQAGMPRLHFADLTRDLDLLKHARDDAFALLESDPDLAAHELTRAVLEARWRDGVLFGEEAG
jgi:ATP-dependent DNA helicase RecG